MTACSTVMRNSLPMSVRTTVLGDVNSGLVGCNVSDAV